MDEVDEPITPQHLPTPLRSAEIERTSANPARARLEEFRGPEPIHKPRPIDTAGDGATRKIPKERCNRGPAAVRFADSDGVSHCAKSAFELGHPARFQMSEQAGGDSRPQSGPAGRVTLRVRRGQRHVERFES